MALCIHFPKAHRELFYEEEKFRCLFKHTPHRDALVASKYAQYRISSRFTREDDLRSLLFGFFMSGGGKKL